MSKNILITSIASKTSLIQRVQAAKEKFDASLQIIGADADANALGAYFTDFFWHMPRLQNLTIEACIDYCLQKNIGYIIPTRDEDVFFFSKYKTQLLEKNIHLFSAEHKAVAFCFDKLKFYEEGDKEWTIFTSENIDAIQTQHFVVKERYGSGADKIAINVDKTQAKEWAKSLVEPIFQPYIQGKEYSIDAYVDASNRCKAAIVRSRDVVIGGESKVTTIVKDEILQKKVEAFVEKYKIQGHSVTQVIKQEDSYFLIECNARFGGASSLSYEAGLESFYWFFQKSNNQAIDVKLSNKRLTQVRSQQDSYFES
jgi:carbamoyl-phosphate synthase large subunit